jgi:hypothetical protein
MLPTIVFFFALLFSLGALEDIIHKNSIGININEINLVPYIVCALWSWLFWLLH